MSDALLRDLTDKVDRLAEQQAALHGEYLEGKRNAKEVARTQAARVSEIAAKVDAIDHRTLKDSATINQVLAQQKVTNGRVTRHDQELDELQRDQIRRDAIQAVRRWRWPAIVAIGGSIVSSVSSTAIAIYFLR